MDTTFNVAVMIVLLAIFSVLVIEYLSYLWIKSASAGFGRYASLRYLKQELGALSADWRLRRMAKRKDLNIDTLKDPEGQIVEMAKARCTSCDSLDICEKLLTSEAGSDDSFCPNAKLFTQLSKDNKVIRVDFAA